MALPENISNWGNYPFIKARVENFSNQKEASSNLQLANSLVVRGSGLSYGDASLSENILSTLHFNKILDFNHKKGVIKVEAGITLDNILKVVVPKGWFLPVTPGTKFITVGGAVAGDVHGKNHHSESSFCRYLTSVEVMLANGNVETCNSTENKDLFQIVCGGLGLSGIILSVEFQLKPIKTSYIHQKNIIVENLNEMLDGLEQFKATTYSVAWIDCLARGKRLGRGVIMLGEHATEDEIKARPLLPVHSDQKIKVPFFFPSFLLNPLSVRLFNLLFFNKHKLGSKDFIVDYDTFFYPLDFVKSWNKLYGSRGFLQYQFVIPFENAKKGLPIILNKISKSGMASFLAVLKALGEGENTISFPIPGFTLALDFPVSNKIFPFLDELDKIIVDLGGRIYLVKDARMSAQTYWKGYPNAQLFKDQVNHYNPSHKFSSSLSKRLEII